MKGLLSLLLIASLHAAWKEELKAYLEAPPPLWMIEQIKSDLSDLDGLDGDIDEALIVSERERPHSHLVRVTIRDGHISVVNRMESYRMNNLWQALKDIRKAAPLPDVDIAINLSAVFWEGLVDIPVFAFAVDKTKKKGIILMPDFELLGGNWHLLEKVERARKEYPWHRKIDMAIWRGSMTDGHYSPYNATDFPRGKLVVLSQEHPEILKAHFILTNEIHRPVVETFPEWFASHLPVHLQLRFKYQILMDGVSCSYSRAWWQLMSNCTLFKQETNDVQWYHRIFKPYEHYIPFANDCSDLIETLHWARQHDKTCKRIADQGRKFAKENMSYARALQYIYLLLQEYGKRMS